MPRDESLYKSGSLFDRLSAADEQPAPSSISTPAKKEEPKKSLAESVAAPPVESSFVRESTSVKSPGVKDFSKDYRELGKAKSDALEQIGKKGEMSDATESGLQAGVTAVGYKLPDHLQAQYDEERKKIDESYQKSRNAMAWVQAISILAQTALKYVASSKRSRTGTDLGAGVGVDMDPLKAQRESLDSQFQMDMKSLEDNRKRMFGELEGEKVRTEARAERKADDDYRSGVEALRASERAQELRLQQAREERMRRAEEGNLTDVQRAQIQTLDRDANSARAKLDPQRQAVLTAMEIAQNPQKSTWFGLGSNELSKEQTAQLKEFERMGIDVGSVVANPEKALPALQAKLDALNAAYQKDVVGREQQIGRIVGLPSEAPPPTQARSSEVTFVASDGKQWTIPASKLEAARAKDPGLRVIK